MKAMVFAAGIGTRLRPLTDSMPKALVEVAGVPVLEHVILSLKSAGVCEAVVNVHHFPEQIRACLIPAAAFSPRTVGLTGASLLLCTMPTL